MNVLERISSIQCSNIKKHILDFAFFKCPNCNKNIIEEEKHIINTQFKSEEYKIHFQCFDKERQKIIDKIETKKKEETIHLKKYSLSDSIVLAMSKLDLEINRLYHFLNKIDLKYFFNLFTKKNKNSYRLDNLLKILPQLQKFGINFRNAQKLDKFFGYESGCLWRTAYKKKNKTYLNKYDVIDLPGDPNHGAKVSKCGVLTFETY